MKDHGERAKKRKEKSQDPWKRPVKGREKVQMMMTKGQGKGREKVQRMKTKGQGKERKRFRG